MRQCRSIECEEDCVKTIALLRRETGREITIANASADEVYRRLNINGHIWGRDTVQASLEYLRQ